MLKTNRPPYGEGEIVFENLQINDFQQVIGLIGEFCALKKVFLLIVKRVCGF